MSTTDCNEHNGTGRTSAPAHLELADGAEVVVYLDDEPMTFRNAHDHGCFVEATRDGHTVVVSLSSRHGVGAQVLDGRDRVVETLDLEMIDKTRNRKVFEPTGSDYGWRVTCRRVTGDNRTCQRCGHEFALPDNVHWRHGAAYCPDCCPDCPHETGWFVPERDQAARGGSR